jgi:hypothetical protein
MIIDEKKHWRVMNRKEQNKSGLAWLIEGGKDSYLIHDNETKEEYEHNGVFILCTTNLKYKNV